MKSFILRRPMLVSALLIAMGSHSFAEVSAQGTSDVAHVKVENASLAEVLAAMRDTYGLRYRSEVSLDTRISGTYDGPLSQVVTHLLNGMNYVLTRNGSNLQVVIVSGAGASPIPPIAAVPIGPSAATPIPVPGGSVARPPQLPAGMVPPPGPPTQSARDK